MGLPGAVAVIDGKLLPLRDFQVDIERDVRTTGQSLGLNQSLSTTHLEIEGMMVVPTVLAVDHFSSEMHEMYLFPESGTRDRVFLTGVIFSGLESSYDERFSQVEFVALDMQR